MLRGTPQKTSAFTLIELSVVLVIIGLITVAVMSGRALMNAARLQKIISEAHSYITAVNGFKLEYGGAMPGDFSDAYSYWNGQSCGAGWKGATKDEAWESCNGNGNGILDNYAILAWRHLSLAGLITDTFRFSNTEEHASILGDCGKYTYGGTCPEQSIPQSQVFARRGWDLSHTSDGGFSSGPIHGYTGHVLFYGTHACDGCWHYNAPSLSASDARNIDTKADDGLPTSGKVHAAQGISGWARESSTDCITAGTPSDWHNASTPTTTYQRSDAVACVLLFFLE